MGQMFSKSASLQSDWLTAFVQGWHFDNVLRTALGMKKALEHRMVAPWTASILV